MATIKAHTDLEQARMLLKILPHKSADMSFNAERDYEVVLYPYMISNWIGVPCWSLAALLNVLPYTIKLSHDAIDANNNPVYKNECYKLSINRCGLFGDKWNTQYYGKHQRQLGKRYKELYIDLFISENYDNLIDACYEMILKLHEHKML